VVSITPRPQFTPGKYSVPILQEAGWAPGPVWRGGKSRPHWDSIPEHPDRIQSLYRLSYRAYTTIYRIIKMEKRQEGIQKHIPKPCSGTSLFLDTQQMTAVPDQSTQEAKFITQFSFNRAL